MAKSVIVTPPDKTFSLYKNSITIDFWELGHVYRIRETGQTPISVTGVTSVKDKSGPLMYWAVNLFRDYLLAQINGGLIVSKEMVLEGSKLHQKRKKEAADVGTKIHEWAHDYVTGKKPAMPVEPLVVNGVMAFLGWVDAHGIKFQSTERIVYSKKHGVVGILDTAFTAKWNFNLSKREDHKILHLGDYKSGNGIYDEAYFQGTAYREFDIEESGRKYGSSWLIRFGKEDGKFYVKEIENHLVYYKGFLGLLAAKRSLKVIANEKKEQKKNEQNDKKR